MQVATAMDSGQFLGSGPHSTQYAAPLGQAPQSNTAVVKVLAGIKVTGEDGTNLLVCSSDSTPYKIDLAIDVDDIERIMQAHTCL